MKFPLSLQKNDQVAVVATASLIGDPTSLDFGMNLLKNWGLRPIVGEHLWASHAQFAATIAERTQDLQKSLDNPDIKAIFCARGGYGTVQLIDLLDFETFLRKPKWLIGYSDVTVLHAHLQKLGIASLHAPMLKGIEHISTESTESLKNVLFGREVLYQFSATRPHNREGRAEGRLIGGNIALLQNMIGTSSDFDTKGKILFLEDVGEPLYNIDRMLRHLERAGKFEGLAALLIGDISKIKPESPAFDKSFYEIIADLTQRYSYPVIFDFPCGHESQNYALVCGAKAHINLKDTQATLTFGCF